MAQAAGDVCEYPDPFRGGERVRVEHWDAAIEQGRTAARGMAGEPTPHEAAPYFFSDFSDWTSLQFVGHARTWSEEVVRGDTEDGAFSVFYLNAGRLTGTLTVGRDEDLEPARALLRSGQDLSGRRAELSDPDTALDLLADEAAPLVITHVRAGQACPVAGGDMGRQGQSANAQLPPATRLPDPDPGDNGPKEWICENCGFIFQVSAGDPDGGVAPGTAFEAIPDDWVCPVCGASKAQFAPL